MVTFLLLLVLAPWSGYLSGDPADARVPCRGGYALIGGAADPLDEAFRWLASRAPGGDVVVLSQSGDFYNAVFQKAGPLNSVETIVINTREAASDPEVIRRVDGAEILFFGGGDQSRYVTRWKGTALEDALNRAIERGAAVGGTSAGLAILGEHCFSALKDTVTSEQARTNPEDERVTLESDFLRIPILKGIITDSHFSERDRMGRLAVFMRRLNAKGIGVDETTALLVEPSGESRRIGKGAVYFVTLKGPQQVEAVELREGRFDLKTWTGDGERETLEL